MATVCTAQRRVSIQQVVSTHPTRSTVLTLKDRVQVLILTRVVPQSRAVGHLGSHTPNTNIIIILVLTVKGVLDILLVHILITMKVVIRCLQTLHTPLPSLFIQAPRPTGGRTLERMPPRHSSNGSQASSLHKTTMEIQSVQPTLQHGLGLELALHHLTNPRTNSTNVLHKWDLNPGHPRPRTPPMESLLK